MVTFISIIIDEVNKEITYKYHAAIYSFFNKKKIKNMRYRKKTIIVWTASIDLELPNHFHYFFQAAS